MVPSAGGGVTNEHLNKMREVLMAGNKKVDNLFTALKSIESMHAETSDGFSETLVRAYGKILESEAEQQEGNAVAA